MLRARKTEAGLWRVYTESSVERGFVPAPERISIMISPVSVLISQLPPEADFGTLISPLELAAVKTFSLSSVPVTSPVLV